MPTGGTPSFPIPFSSSPGFSLFFSLSFLFIYFSPLKPISPFPLPLLYAHTHTSPSTITVITASDVILAPLPVTPSPTTSSHSFSFYLSFLSTPTLIPSTFILVASKMVSNHFLLPFDFYSTFFGDLGFCLLAFGSCLQALRLLGLHGCWFGLTYYWILLLGLFESIWFLLIGFFLVFWHCAESGKTWE